MTGRLALVTGGGTGIGLAITRQLLAEDYRVIVVQRTGEDAVTAARTLADVQADRIATVAADLATASGCAAAASAVGGAPLHLLVHNAAVTGQPALTPLDADSGSEGTDGIDLVIDTNLKAPLRLTRTLLDRFTNGSVIITIGSIAAYRAQPDAAAYAASKAGLIGLTQALASDLGPRGVRAVHVAVGNVATEASRDPAYLGRRRAAGQRTMSPLGRAGTPADIAAAVAWLARPAAGYITGTSLVIDGGALTAAPPRPLGSPSNGGDATSTGKPVDEEQRA